MQDAACDASKLSRLAYAARNQTFPDVWAVDRERNCYLFLQPAVTSADGWNFMAFIDGYMYALNRVGLYGHEVYFDEKNLPSAEASAAVQEQIRRAFAVFGAFGTGADDEPLYPLFTTRQEAC